MDVYDWVCLLILKLETTKVWELKKESVGKRLFILSNYSTPLFEEQINSRESTTNESKYSQDIKDNTMLPLAS